MGAPDPTFGGGDGFVETDVLGVNEGDGANAVALDSQGRILVAGSAGDGVSTMFAIARYTENGVLDTSFSTAGVDGSWIADIGNDGETDSARAITTDSSGRIVAAGDQGGPAAENNFAVVRLLDDGTPDVSFDGNGIQGTDFPGGVTNDAGRSLAIDGQGRIVVAGFTSGTFAPDKMAVARYLPDNGADDPSFGTNGARVVDFPGTSDSAYGIVIGKANRIILGGVTEIAGADRMAVVRLKQDGTFDTGFSGDGVTTVASPPGSYTTANTLLQDPDGRLILAGSADPKVSSLGPYDFAVARLGASGKPDRSFDRDGIVRFGFGPGTSDLALSAALDPRSGRIVVGGLSQSGTDGSLALARLEAEKRCLGKAPTVVGTAKGETIRGTNGKDVIYGGRGKDKILGKGGNDLLCGGPGRDKLIGGPGKDKTKQ